MNTLHTQLLLRSIVSSRGHPKRHTLTVLKFTFRTQVRIEAAIPIAFHWDQFQIRERASISVTEEYLACGGTTARAVAAGAAGFGLIHVNPTTQFKQHDGATRTG